MEDDAISEVVNREGSRLRRFIRGRVSNPRDAEDILQDVFFELVEANRLLMPIEHISGWLFRVARNRIIDLFRRKQPDAFDLDWLEELVPSTHDGPVALYERSVMLAHVQRAIDELPADQRAVFVAHEIEGRSFKELAAEQGVSINTLLSRKHYAVRQLRVKLQTVFDELRKG